MNTNVKRDSVVGIFQSREQAEMAVERLKSAAFSGQDISVLFPNRSEATTFAKDEGTKASEDALKGIGTGGILGGLTGWLVGIGALAIPGLGPFIAAGPIMGLLGGAAIGGTIGGLTGALIGMGVPEETAQRYETGLKEGRILIAVQAPTQEERLKAKEILQACGAVDITMTGESQPASSTVQSVGSTAERAKDKVMDTLRGAKEEVKDTAKDIKDRKVS